MRLSLSLCGMAPSSQIAEKHRHSRCSEDQREKPKKRRVDGLQIEKPKVARVHPEQSRGINMVIND